MESDLRPSCLSRPWRRQRARVGNFDDPAVFVFQGLGQARGEQQDDAGNGEEGNLRQPGDASERDHNAGGDLQRAPSRQQLRAEIGGEGGVRGGAGHHHASRHRDQKRRDQGDQAVATVSTV